MFSATLPRAPHFTSARENESTAPMPVIKLPLPPAITRTTQVLEIDLCQPGGRDRFRHIEVRHLYPDVQPSYRLTVNGCITENG